MFNQKHAMDGKGDKQVKKEGKVEIEQGNWVRGKFNCQFVYSITYRK